MNTRYVDSTEVIVESRPNISWGAIFAGAFVAFVVNITLLSLGSGIGFTSFDPGAGDSLGRGTAISAGVFALIAGLLSIGAGGFVAGRLAGFQDRAVATLHGLCSWAVVSTVTLVMIAMGVGNVASLAFGLVGNGISGIASVGAQAVSNVDISANPRTIAGEAKQILRDTGKLELQPENLRAKAQAVPGEAARAQAQAGGANGADVVQREGQPIAQALDEDAVAAVIARRTGLSQADAKSLIGQSEDKARQVWGSVQEKAKVAGLRAAEKASDVAAAASWFSFAMLVVGAVAGGLGGLMGRPLAFMEAPKRRPAPRATLDQPLKA